MSNKHRFSAFTVFVTSILLLTLVAVPVLAQEQPEIILRVGTGDSGEGLTPHQQIIEMFEAENPDILVQLEAVAGRDYYARLLTQVAADAAPDIMQIGDDAVSQFVDAGAILPLDDFLTSAQYPLDTAIYLPGLLEPGRYQGSLYFLPKDYTPLAIYYNKKIFDQFNVSYPNDHWTWDELLETAKALTQDTDGDGKTDIWGIQLPANWTSGFEYWVAAAGGSLISPDGKSYENYMDSPATISAVRFYADMYNVHKVAPPPADLSLFAGGNSEFDSGKAAMRIFGRWPQSGMLQNPNIDLGVVSPPGDATRANVLFWGGFGISSTSQNPEAAWRFLRFYAGEQAAEVWKDWALPTVKSVAEESGLLDDPLSGVWIDQLNNLAPRAYTFNKLWGQTGDSALRIALETVLIDPTADVKAVMGQAAQDAQTALDQLSS